MWMMPWLSDHSMQQQKGLQWFAQEETQALFQRVINTTPWVITVGTSTIDRTFLSRVVLGNNLSLVVGTYIRSKDRFYKPKILVNEMFRFQTCLFYKKLGVGLCSLENTGINFSRLFMLKILQPPMHQKLVQGNYTSFEIIWITLLLFSFHDHVKIVIVYMQFSF
jgi:hypothetical protein